MLTWLPWAKHRTIPVLSPGIPAPIAEPPRPDPPAGAAAILTCPRCGTEFFPPVLEYQYPIDAADSDQEGDPDDADQEELSSLRIRQIAALRRGAYRSRSYCMIGAAALLATTIELIIMTVQRVRAAGWSWLPTLYAAAAALSFLGAWRLVVKIRSLSQEVRHTLLNEPTEPPDFTPLSDGSQHVKNLEEL